MRTLVISDLHLGSASRSDLLRSPALRATLIDALRDVDRLVLLGDVLELRHGPSANALRAAGPVLQDLGAAMAGKQIVLLAGNHDHALVERWLERRSEDLECPPLERTQTFSAEEASPLAESLARWAGPAEVTVAYPGLAIRDDVYAIHGHYLDCHLTVPTMERLAIAAMGRLLDRPPESLRSVDDYEAVSAPVFAWINAVAATGKTGSALNGTTTMRMWRALDKDRPATHAANGYAAKTDATNGRVVGTANGGGGASGAGEASGAGGARGACGARGAANGNGDGDGDGASASMHPLARGDRSGDGEGGTLARVVAAARPRADGAKRLLRREAVRRGFPLAVAALNRAQLGPVQADVSSTALRRAGLEAMGEVATRLGVSDRYVIFGHTHRVGPLRGDDEHEWTPNGVKLVNTGSWTYSPGFLTPTPGESPYWPGSCVIVEEQGPPRIERLLLERSHEELRAARS